MFKVATWNVNSVKARLERLLNFLERAKPDVVCLQELKCIEEQFPFEPLKAAGYSVAAFGQKSYNGVALLSRHPITDVVRGFGDGDEDVAARFVGGTIKGIRIFSAYIPNGQAVGSEKYEYKLKWLKRLSQYLATHADKTKPLLLMGDFNVAPEDRDVHDPKAWEGMILFSEPEKAALRKVCEFGLQDTFRRHHPEPGLYSWWDYRMLSFPKNKGLRIDFILATQPAMEVCTAASIDREERKGQTPSDHAPVIAEFDY